MNWFDRIVLLLAGLSAAYMAWRLLSRYRAEKKLFDVYYLLGMVVILVSGVLLIFLGYDILASPLILTVASLIPLGISLGVANQYYPQWKKYYSWFALVGFLAIAITSIGGMEIKKYAVMFFHSIAGFVIFLGPIFAQINGKAKKGYFWVGVGGVFIGLGGIALAFLTMGTQLLFLSSEIVFMILAPILLAMTLSFTWGLMKDYKLD